MTTLRTVNDNIKQTYFNWEMVSELTHTFSLLNRFMLVSSFILVKNVRYTSQYAKSSNKLFWVLQSGLLHTVYLKREIHPGLVGSNNN